MNFEILMEKSAKLLGFEIRLFWLILVIYALSSVFYLFYLIFPRSKIKYVGTIILICGAILHTFLIFFRGFVSGYPPFQTLYESLSWFAWSVVVAYLIMEFITRVRLPGLLTTLLAISGGLYALLGVKIDPSIKPLSPALQSPWFVIHVFVGFTGYAALVVAFCVEVAYLIFAPSVKKGSNRYDLDIFSFEKFHRWAYRLVLFGYPLLTLCIFSGAMWADVAWGRYWGWDPKESWSLITWLVYSLYLHAMSLPRWSKTRASILNIIGFLAMVTTFIGVSWLAKLFGIPSLHLYGL